MTGKLPNFLFLFSVILITSIYYSSHIKSVKNIAGVTDQSTSNIKGLIIPHHDLAKQYIISTLSDLSQNQNFSTVVLIGPNHFQPDSRNFLSTISLENYPIDTGLVDTLIDNQLVLPDHSVCQQDHSLTTPLVYLKQFFPNTLFIPILSPQFFNKTDIYNLSTYLAQNLPSDTLYIASVDFSHNYTLMEALNKNDQSIQALTSFNYDLIYSFKDDHLDSPASIGLLLNIMQQLNSTNWSLVYNSHGSFIEDKLDMQSTSYLIGTFK